MCLLQNVRQHWRGCRTSSQAEMPRVKVEYSKSGWSRCQVCRKKIQNDVLRVVLEGLPNPYSHEDDLYKSYHFLCWRPGPRTIELRVHGQECVRPADQPLFTSRLDTWKSDVEFNKQALAAKETEKVEQSRELIRKKRKIAEDHEPPGTDLTTADCLLLQLPCLIWDEMLSYLVHPDDLIALGATCKVLYHEIHRRDYLWKNVITALKISSKHSKKMLKKYHAGSWQKFVYHICSPGACVACDYRRPLIPERGGRKCSVIKFLHIGEHEIEVSICWECFKIWTPWPWVRMDDLKRAVAATGCNCSFYRTEKVPKVTFTSSRVAYFREMEVLQHFEKVTGNSGAILYDHLRSRRLY